MLFDACIDDTQVSLHEATIDPDVRVGDDLYVFEPSGRIYAFADGLSHEIEIIGMTTHGDAITAGQPT